MESPSRSVSYIASDFKGTGSKALTSTSKSAEESLLEVWEHRNLGEASIGEVQSLLHAAVGAPDTRAPGVTDRLLRLLMKLYRAQQDKTNVLRLICTDFGFASQQAYSAAQSLLDSRGGRDAGGRGVEAELRALKAVRQAARPQYASVFVPISNQPGGIKFLSDLRADAIHAARIEGGAPHSPHFRALSDVLRESLSEWFSVGLLQLERICWHSSPASLLEKVMQYEQVHEFDEARPWADLKARLSPQRRVFGFFHPSMPEEPLVLLHTALMPSITTSLDDILVEGAKQRGRPEEASAAIFYSISSTQGGLAGIDLGNSLIKQAAHRLLGELPQLRHLSTLSPIPGFSRWLLTALDQAQLSPQTLLGQSVYLGLTAAEAAVLQGAWAEARSAAPGGAAKTSLPSFEAVVMAAAGIGSDSHASVKTGINQLWQDTLSKLVIRYLVVEKRRGNALDPVANFHLRNGAELYSINWKACSKPESFGMMVNYRYDLEAITKNNQAYIRNRKIAVSSKIAEAVGKLAASWK